MPVISPIRLVALCIQPGAIVDCEIMSYENTSKRLVTIPLWSFMYTECKCCDRLEFLGIWLHLSPTKLG